MHNGPVIKRQKPAAASAAPRPSRIRRDPPGRVPDKTVNAYPAEREMWTVIIGVIAFAVALAVIIVGFSDWLNG